MGKVESMIYCLGFCADDMQLYLDTHPQDKNAIDYFNQCNELLRNAREEYSKKYGEILVSDISCTNSWDWNAGKMPWEGVDI